MAGENQLLSRPSSFAEHRDALVSLPSGEKKVAERLRHLDVGGRAQGDQLPQLDGGDGNERDCATPHDPTDPRPERLTDHGEEHPDRDRRNGEQCDGLRFQCEADEQPGEPGTATEDSDGPDDERSGRDLTEHIDRSLDRRGRVPGVQPERHGDRYQTGPATADPAAEHPEPDEQGAVKDEHDDTTGDHRIHPEREHCGDRQQHDRTGGDARVERRELAPRQAAVAGVPQSGEQVHGHRQVERFVLPQPHDGERGNDDQHLCDEDDPEERPEQDGCPEPVPGDPDAPEHSAHERLRHGLRLTLHTSAIARALNSRSRFGGSFGRACASPHIVPVAIDPRRGMLRTRQ